MQIIKPDVNVRFVQNRKIAYILSAALVIGSILSLVLHGGPKYGIDFAGGAEALVKFSQPVPIGNVKSALKSIGMKGSVQQYGDQRSDYYRILLSADQSDNENMDQALKKGLEAQTNTVVSIESFEMVGAQVGSDMREKALLAMFFALLFITIYISGRFELKWAVSAGMAGVLALSVYALFLLHLSIPILMIIALVFSLILFWVLNLKYAMGAIVALLHDVTITVGFFSFLARSSHCR